jgi:hypothetical protein
MTKQKRLDELLKKMNKFYELRNSDNFIKNKNELLENLSSTYTDRYYLNVIQTTINQIKTNYDLFYQPIVKEYFYHLIDELIEELDNRSYGSSNSYEGGIRVSFLKLKEIIENIVPYSQVISKQDFVQQLESLIQKLKSYYNQYLISNHEYEKYTRVFKQLFKETTTFLINNIYYVQEPIVKDALDLLNPIWNNVFIGNNIGKKEIVSMDGSIEAMELLNALVYKIYYGQYYMMYLS